MLWAFYSQYIDLEASWFLTPSHGLWQEISEMNKLIMKLMIMAMETINWD